MKKYKHDNDFILAIAITNLGKYNSGVLVSEWVNLPASKKEFKEAFEKIGINERYEEFFISDFENYTQMNLNIDEYCDVLEINKLAKMLDGLDEQDYEKLVAWTEISELDTKQIIELLDKGNLDDILLYKGVTNDEELGLHVSEIYEDIPENFVNYIDWEAFGKNYRIENGGSYTPAGYIEYIEG